MKTLLPSGVETRPVAIPSSKPGPSVQTMPKGGVCAGEGATSTGTSTAAPSTARATLRLVLLPNDLSLRRFIVISIGCPRRSMGPGTVRSGPAPDTSRSGAYVGRGVDPQAPGGRTP